MYVRYHGYRGNKLADKTIKVHQDFKRQSVDLYYDMDDDDMYDEDSNAADAVSNIEEYNLATNQQKGNAVAEVHHQDEGSPHHQSQNLVSQIRNLEDSYAKVGLDSVAIPSFTLLTDS